MSEKSIVLNGIRSHGGLALDMIQKVSPTRGYNLGGIVGLLSSTTIKPVLEELRRDRWTHLSGPEEDDLFFGGPSVRPLYENSEQVKKEVDMAAPLYSEKIPSTTSSSHSYISHESVWNLESLGVDEPWFSLDRKVEKGGVDLSNYLDPAKKLAVLGGPFPPGYARLNKETFRVVEGRTVTQSTTVSPRPDTYLLVWPGSLVSPTLELLYLHPADWNGPSRSYQYHSCGIVEGEEFHFVIEPAQPPEEHH